MGQITNPIGFYETKMINEWRESGDIISYLNYKWNKINNYYKNNICFPFFRKRMIKRFREGDKKIIEAHNKRMLKLNKLEKIVDLNISKEISNKIVEF